MDIEIRLISQRSGGILFTYFPSELLFKRRREKIMDLFNRMLSRRTAAKSMLSAGAAGLVVASQAEAAQPHMEAALKALNNASSQLEMAVDDKAGHRAKAIQLVSQAINQVQQGIQAGAGK
jgi:hypothetical protein